MNITLFFIAISIVLAPPPTPQLLTGDGIAIHRDSPSIISWATSATVERGYINIADPSQEFSEGGISSNKAFYGSIGNVIGPANGNFLSLGDGGYVILEFEHPITNGPGPDFAVFENAIYTPPNQTELAFVELAFVEVSSDGINYERFPAVSNQQYEKQIGTFDPVDWTLYENLAGVYPVFYGYPFDLDDIPGEIVDKNRISHVRIVDVVGNIDPEFASYDSDGNIINDPWPTPFHTCGFDLDAVAVINELKENNNTTSLSHNEQISIFPNPAKDFIIIKSEGLKNISLNDLSGVEIINKSISGNEYSLNVADIKTGTYILIVNCDKKRHSKKIIISD